jgi:glucosamine--fructose-6-phosphate aminotransferase (isomerizing)
MNNSISTSLSTNAYVTDILQQPQAIRDTLSAFGKRNIDDVVRFAERLSSNSLKRVLLTGMGSSYHGLHPLQLKLVEHGIQAQMIETSELIHFSPKLLSSDTLVVAVSQSGQSVEIVQLLKLMQKGVPLIGVTNTPESLLAQNSDSVLITQAGSENSVSCKTYITALAALAILGDLLTGNEHGRTISALETSADAMSQYLSRWESFVESAIQKMDGIQYLILAGRGPSLAAAGTGGLIIKEAAHFPAEGMSCAAFRHGPLEMLSPKVFVLVYEGFAPTQKLNVGLVGNIQKAGGQSELITTASEKAYIYNLPPVSEVCLPLMEILPAQLTSVALAVLNNHTAGNFERASKITVVE